MNELALQLGYHYIITFDPYGMWEYMKHSLQISIHGWIYHVPVKPDMYMVILKL